MDLWYKGTPYDEYVDNYDYFIANADGKTVQSFGDFKSKTLKTTCQMTRRRLTTIFAA